MSSALPHLTSIGSPRLNETAESQHRAGLFQRRPHSRCKDKCKLWWLGVPMVCLASDRLQALALSHPECRIMRGDGNCGWRGKVFPAISISRGVLTPCSCGVWLFRNPVRAARHDADSDGDFEVQVSE
jgi:hypothetical protein